MSEIKRWATEFLDAVDGQDVGFWMRSLARAILADASPASQERDEDDVLHAAERGLLRGISACGNLWGDDAPAPIKRQANDAVAVMRECLEVVVAARARLRSGIEPGEHGWSVDHPKGSIADLTEDEAHTHAQLLDANGRGPAFVIRPDGTEDAEHFAPAARPSGGEGVKWEEHGVTPSKPERWRGYSAYPGNPAYPVEWPHDPSGGEGAPEPDGVERFLSEISEIVHTAFRKGTYGEAGSKVWRAMNDCWNAEDSDDWNGAWDWVMERAREYIDRLPPEREACSTCTEGEPPYFCRECVHQREEKLRGALEREAEAREPDAMTYAKDPRRDLAEWSEVLAVRRFDPEKCKTDGSGPPWPVFFGTPGPDREAEIRADQTRKVLAKVRERLVDVRQFYTDRKQSAVFTEVLRVLARLSPTDEQESPNRSDEP